MDGPTRTHTQNIRPDGHPDTLAEMFDVVVAAAVLVIGSLLVVQTFIMRQCFQVGQPNSNSHFSNEVLTNEGKED